MQQGKVVQLNSSSWVMLGAEGIDASLWAPSSQGSCTGCVISHPKYPQGEEEAFAIPFQDTHSAELEVPSPDVPHCCYHVILIRKACV